MGEIGYIDGKDRIERIERKNKIDNVGKIGTNNKVNKMAKQGKNRCCREFLNRFNGPYHKLIRETEDNLKRNVHTHTYIYIYMQIYSIHPSIYLYNIEIDRWMN